MPTVADTSIGGRVRRSLWSGVKTARKEELLVERKGNRSINQAINVVTGRIDSRQIIKWAMILLIILGLGIFFVNVLRGFAVGIDQISCGLSHICLNPSGCGGYEHVCDPEAPDTIITTIYAFWEAEWFMRCLFYLCLAVIIGLLIYQWAGWLMGKLLHADQDAEKLKNWVYGSKWFERGSDEGLETRL